MFIIMISFKKVKTSWRMNASAYYASCLTSVEKNTTVSSVE